jgi:hypothetical protein
MSEVKPYPVSETYTVLDGYDIYRSNNMIIALVVVESQFGRDLRLYRWIKKKDQWKVDLCRMGVARWNWSQIYAKASEFIDKYGLAAQRQQQDVEATTAMPSGEEESE